MSTTAPFSRTRRQALAAARRSPGPKVRDAEAILARGQKVVIGGREYRWRHTGTLQYHVRSGTTWPVTSRELERQIENQKLMGPFAPKGTLVRVDRKRMLA